MKKIRKLKKKKTSQDFLFDKLPEECNVCKKPFDKKDKMMAKTWFVEVFREQEIVLLYCPECYKQ
jgi:uncharacterized protein with PIN domain